MTYRRSESGNVFFTLFGAVALVGVIGAATATLMRGPVGSMVNLNQRAKADSQIQIASKLAMLEASQQADSGDCDGDGYVEPLPPVTAGCATHPTGGGCLPNEVGSAKLDPWGTAYGYCAWDHGAQIGTACNGTLLAGTNAQDKTVVAIISAGSDRVFQTSCSDDPTYITKGANTDDVLIDFTYAAAVEASGGLWKLKSGTPGTATIDKNIEVSGTASFQSGITGNTDFSSGNFSFANASGFFLPDQTNSGPCTPSNVGSLRTNGTSGQVLQICDPNNATDPDNDFWIDVGGSGATTAVAGTDGQVQYNNGGAFGGDSGLVWDDTTDKLTATNLGVTTDAVVGGTLDVTGDVTMAGKLDVTGDSTYAGKVDVTGNLSTDADLDAGGNTHLGGNLDVDNNTALGGTLGVTGVSTFGDDALIKMGSAGDPGLAFTSASTTGLFYSSGGIGMSVGGTLRTEVTSSGLAVSGDATASGDIAADGGVAGDSFEVGSIGSGVGLFSDTAGGLLLQTAGLPRLQIDSAGDIGIALVGAPTTDLDIGGVIRLRQMGATAGSNCGAINGAITYSSGDELLICSNVTGNWETIGTSGGGGGGVGNYWTKLVDGRLYYNTDDVGVGTNDPLARFHVSGGDLLVTGTHTGTASMPVGGAGTRLVFDDGTGAFRAGTVSGAQWNDASVGDQSIAIGNDVTASGASALALGNRVTASGNYSMALGLGNIATTGIVSGADSFGIFMGNQSGVNLSDSDVMGLFGGKLVIDPNAPATHLTTDGTLTVDVEGDVGATQYCDEQGNNCFTAADVAGGTTGAPGNNREIIYNSGGILGASSTFVFTSSGYMGLGTASPAAKLDVADALRIGSSQLGCAAGTKGAIRYNSATNVFDFCNGSAWSSIGSGGALALDDLSDAKTDYATDHNMWLGSGAGASIAAGGQYNIALGENAGAAVSTGDNNVFIGESAGAAANTGAGNVGIGRWALKSVTGNNNNTAVGYLALTAATGGSNTSVGSDSLRTLTTGVSNTALGNGALYTNSTSNDNTGIGYNALQLATGANNIALGASAGDAITTGANNIVIGYDVDAPLATGSNQLVIGNLLFGTGIDGTGTALSSGNIGVGTASPAAKLDVADAVKVGSSQLGCATATKGAIRYNSSTDGFDYCGGTTPSWTAFASAASAGAAAGSTGYVQFKSSTGNLGGDSSFFWDDTNKRLGIGTVVPPSDFSMYKAISPKFIMTSAGTDTASQTVMSFLTLSGSSGDALGSGSSKGWQIYSRGNAWSTAAVANDMGFAFWDGSTWKSVLGLDSVNGYVGIGTAQPVTRLEVTDAIRIGSSTLGCAAGMTGAIRYNSTNNNFDYCGGSTPAWTSFASSVTPGGSDKYVQYNNNGVLAGASGLVFNSSNGYVGIGTTSPQNAVHVYAAGGSGLEISSQGVSGTSQSAITMLTSASGAGDYLPTATSKGWEIHARGDAYTTSAQRNDLGFSYWNGSYWVDPLLIDSATAYVGIYTTSPAAALDVGDAIRVGSSTLGCATGTKGAIRYNSSTNGFDYCGGSTPSWTAFLGGSVTPAGSDQQVQINSQGVLYASSGLTYNSSTGLLTSVNRISVGGSGHDTNSVMITGGNTTSTGTANVFIGGSAGAGNTTGAGNIAIGYQASQTADALLGNTAIGYQALKAATTGADLSTAVGYQALAAATTGGMNTALGNAALLGNTDGYQNTAVGYAAGSIVQSGIGNTFIGKGAMQYAGTASYNAVVGQNAGDSMQSGSSNVIFGQDAASGGTNLTFDGATIIGKGAGYLNDGDGNIFIGYLAGDAVTTGTNNIVIGYNVDAPSATGSNQLAIGNLLFGTGLDGTGTSLSSGKIGIGTSSPAAKLDVAEAVKVGSSVLGCASGTKGAIRYNSSTDGFDYCGGTTPSWTAFASAASAGAAAGSTGYVQFRSSTGNLGGDSKLFWDDTNKRLGIGTVSPAKDLHIKNASGSAEIALEPNSGASGYLTQNASGNFFYYDPSTATSPFVINNDSSNNMVTIAGSSVGIGTSSPAATLDVSGATRIGSSTLGCATGTKGAIRYNSTNNNFDYCGGSGPAWTSFASSVTPGGSDKYVQYNNNGTLAGASGLVFDSSTGNVGIGTATPQKNLHVHAADISNIQVSTVGSTVSGQSIVDMLTNASGGSDSIGSATSKGWQIYARGNAYTGVANEANDLGFAYWNGTTWGQVLHLDSAAYRVGILTDTPAAALDVREAVRVGSSILGCAAGTTGAIRYNSSTNGFDYCGGSTPAWTAFLGGSVTPAGSDQQVQLNSQGVLYASSGLKFNSTSGLLTVGQSGTTAGLVQVAAGAAATPAYSFFGDSDTGLYSSGANSFSIAAGGAEKFRVTASQAVGQAGTASSAGYAFIGDTDTGMYQIAAETLGFTTAGTLRMTVQDPGSANAIAVFAGTSAITLPSGLDATRPSTPVNGMIRYNTTSNDFDIYANGGWKKIVMGASSAGTVTPAGSDQQIQLNSQGVLYASTGLTFSSSTGVLTVANRAVIGGSGKNTNSVFVTGGNLTATGADNVVIGSNAGNALTTSNANVVIGKDALKTQSTAGGANVAVGYQALQLNTSANNVAVGYLALGSNSIQQNNTAVGYQAASGMTGGNAVAVGYLALSAGGASDGAVALGAGALSSATGTGNIGIGNDAGNNITSGTKNIVIGYDVDAPSATASNQLNIGNVLFGTGFNGTNAATVNTAGRVGIVTNSPAAALDVADAVRIGSSTLGCATGTKGAIRYNSTNDNFDYCGGSSPAWTSFSTVTAAGSTGYVQFKSSTGSLGGDSKLFWDDTNKYLGIGTASPQAKLDVIGGNALFDNNQGIDFKNSSGTDVGTALKLTSGNNFEIRNLTAAGSLQYSVVNGTGIHQFNTGAGYVERMRIANDGKVGIGTASPAALLDVAEAVRVGSSTLGCATGTKGAIRYNSTNDNFDYCGGSSPAWTSFSTVTAAGSTGYVQFKSSTGALGGDSGLFWDDTNKRLGIGTTSPGSLINTAKTFTAGSTGWGEGVLFTATGNGASASYLGVVGTRSYATINSTGATHEAFGVYGSGYAGNDATAQQATAFLADFRLYAGDTGYGISIQDDNASTGGTGYGVYINLDDTNITRYGIYQATANNNYFAGNIGIGTTSPAAPLDVSGAVRVGSSTLGCATGTKGSIRYNSTGNNFDYCGGAGPTWTAFGTPPAETIPINDLSDAKTDYTTDHNMWLGSGAGAAIASGGQYNVALGENAGAAVSTGDNNIFIGESAGAAVNTGTGNVGIGRWALKTATSGSNNTAIGYLALQTATGGSNTSVGSDSSRTLTTGVSNTALGNGALYSNSTSNDNTAIGYNALQLATGANNIGLGSKAGDAITTGGNNIVIGYDVDAPSATTSNQLNVGNVMFGTGFNVTNGTTVNTSGRVGIAKNNPAVTLDVVGDIQYTGTITDVSDRRLKKDIHPLAERGSMLEKLGGLGTYSFRMKNPAPDDANQVEFGVMAQEIEKVFPELVRHDSSPEHYMSVNYVGLIAPMIEAGKELEAQNKALKAEVAGLKAQQADMKTAMAGIKADVEGLKAHTGYGINKAGMNVWMLLALAGACAGNVLAVFLMSRRKKA